MRPRTLDEFVGQEHLVGERGPLRRASPAATSPRSSCGARPAPARRRLARLLADAIGADFTALSAVMSGVAEVRAAIAAAQERLALNGTRTVLFIDEIHRFNKAQQDALLPHVEDGTVTLIGATTENPYFEVNAALLSRMRVWRLEPLTDEDVGARRPAGARRRRARPRRRARAGGRRRPGRRGLRRTSCRSPAAMPAPRSTCSRARPRWPRPRTSATPRATSARARGRRGGRPATRPRLRPGRRRPLRHRLRVHQEPARQRPGRGPLLAGGDDRGRRGPQVHRPPADHQRLGGRRERRPARAVGGGRRRPGARLDRAARGAVRAGPGDDLHRHGAEVEPVRQRLLGGRRATSRPAARCPSRSTCATPPTAG